MRKKAYGLQGYCRDSAHIVRECTVAVHGSEHMENQAPRMQKAGAMACFLLHIWTSMSGRQ